MERIRAFVLLFALLSACNLWAQPVARQAVRKGNRLYHKGHYAESEAYYRRGGSLPAAQYNLGNARLRQNDGETAEKCYKQAIAGEKSPLYKAQMHHNLGVVYQAQRNYGAAIEQYEHALRLNPHDDQTRYNLSLCKHLLKNNKGGGGGSSGQPKPQKQQDASQNKQSKQNKDDQNDRNQQQQQQPQNGMSKDNAQRLLDLTKMEEQQTQRKIQQNRYRNRSQSNRKNW